MKNTALAITACLLGSAAWAQTAETSGPFASGTASVELPAPFTGVPNLSESDSISGLDTWVSQGTNMMFMHDPETGTLIAGFPFDTEGNSLHPALADQENADFETMVTELFGPVVEIPEEYVQTVEERLAAYSEEERSAALADLIERLSDVEGEEAFNTAVEGWINALEPVDDGVQDTTEGDAADDTTEVDSVESSSAGDIPTDTPAADDVSEEGEGISLLDGVRRSFTMQIGEPDAPLIYVITDPSCEPCRVTNDLLRDKVEAGELQMRVVMVDVVDEDSLGTIAGIVTSDDPAQTYLAMTAEEGVEMPFARTSGIPEEVVQGLEANYAMAEAFKVPQLPMIAFDTEDGPAYISGAPAPEQLASALPPSEADDSAPVKASDDAPEEAPEDAEADPAPEPADAAEEVAPAE